MNTHAPNVAVIGGGTGSFTLLQELKHFTPNISAIVNMSDDGGSTGLLRDTLGVLPPGDVRQCLVALSNEPDARRQYDYRFGPEAGTFANQSLGNVILAAFADEYGSFAEAVKQASLHLRVTGQVLPVSLDNHNLAMRDGDETIHGEFKIAHRPIRERATVRVYLEPEAVINPEVETAIEKAHLIVISPGNLYGSLLPALSVRGMAEAIQAAQAPVIAVANLVNKPNQTDDWHVADYVKELEKYIGEGQITHALFNNAPPTAEMLTRYAAEAELPVRTDEHRFQEVCARAIGAALVAKEAVVQNPNDTLIRRTLMRHDAVEVGRQLMKLYYSESSTIQL